jgi:hypothetical protein
MIPGKRGFAFLPILIILASVLIGTGSVLVLREKMDDGDANIKTQITNDDSNPNDEFSSPQTVPRTEWSGVRGGAEESDDEAEGLKNIISTTPSPFQGTPPQLRGRKFPFSIFHFPFSSSPSHLNIPFFSATL